MDAYYIIAADIIPWRLDVINPLRKKKGRSNCFLKYHAFAAGQPWKWAALLLLRGIT